MKNLLKLAEKFMLLASFACCATMTESAFAATYPSAGNGTEPNVWTRNYSGVLAAAKTTGYPIFLIIVNSPSCGHCSTMMNKTVNTDEFATMERELTFYKVIVDEAYSGGSSDYRTCINKYRGYFDYSMYPAVLVLRTDGSVYGGFGNKTTDKRSVAADIRGFIEALAIEQNADIWSGSGVTPSVPADPPTPAAPPAPTAAGWAAKHKGSGNGIVFDVNQKVSAFCALKMNAKGKVTVKFTNAGGRKTEKGELTLSDDAIPQVKTAGLDISYDESTAMWLGEWNGGKVFIPFGKRALALDGVYTLGAQSANGEKAGYLTVTMRRSKGKVAGMLGGKNKISTNGEATLLPASVVAEMLPDWSVGEDLVFVPAVKRGGVSGGIAVTKSGTASGTVAAFGANWNVSGAKWASSANLNTMDGMVFSVSGRDIDILVIAQNGSQIGFGDNDYSAKIKATVRTGLFKGNLRSGKEKIPFAGALVRVGKTIVGRGVTLGKGSVFPVVIESPCGGDCAVSE